MLVGGWDIGTRRNDSRRDGPRRNPADPQGTRRGTSEHQNEGIEPPPSNPLYASCVSISPPPLARPILSIFPNTQRSAIDETFGIGGGGGGGGWGGTRGAIARKTQTWIS